jgi:hypothetical protein
MRLPAGIPMENTNKIRTAVSVFELPQKLGILQYVEYEPKEWCTSYGCQGILTAEGCRRGICIKYRAWVYSKDRRRWEAKERWRRRRDEDAGGCIRQQAADALWELAGRFEVGLWYDGECGIVVNGVRLPRPHCRTAEECVKQILEDYRREVERAKQPPPPDPAEVEYKVLVEKYAWLKNWRKDIVVEHLKREKKLFLEMLERLANPEVPDIVPLFLSRFDVSLGCVVEVFRGIDDGEMCVSFCVDDGKMLPRILVYCYKKEVGWHCGEKLRFLKMGIIDGRLREIYVSTLSSKRYVRIV